MSFSIIIPHLEGTPQSFYDICVEEINKAKIPDRKYDWSGEERKQVGTRGFPETVEDFFALSVQDKVNIAYVFAYRFGPHFFVSTRLAFVDEKQTAKRMDTGTFMWTYLDGVHHEIFGRLIDQAARDALARYMKQMEMEVPESLRPEDVFHLQPHSPEDEIEEA